MTTEKVSAREAIRRQGYLTAAQALAVVDVMEQSIATSRAAADGLARAEAMIVELRRRDGLAREWYREVMRMAALIPDDVVEDHPTRRAREAFRDQLKADGVEP